MRKALFITALIASLSLAISWYVWTRTDDALRDAGRTIARLKSEAEAADRHAATLQRQITVLQASAIQAAPAVVERVETPVEVVTPLESPAPPPKAPTGPVTTNALRDVLMTIEQCALANKTLRCSFSVTNQGEAEKKFILAIGGRYSRFEEERGGACVFDDLGNDFLSAGGAVGNQAAPTCDSSGSCHVEKTLTPGVRTPMWIRFDNVDPKASIVKLLRVKWSDGYAWVAMDFRNIAVRSERHREAGRIQFHTDVVPHFRRRSRDRRVVRGGDGGVRAGGGLRARRAGRAGGARAAHRGGGRPL